MTDFVPTGGLPPQSQLLSGRAVFTEAYAVIPKGCQSDIVTSYLPHWTGTRLWVLARPLSGFAETFSHYLMDVAPGGGSETPEPNADAEGVLYVVSGSGVLTLGTEHALKTGSYAFLPPGTDWSVTADQDGIVFHWIRKRYAAVDGIDAPHAFVMDVADAEIVSMPDTSDSWTTTRFVSPEDMSHDMHVNIVTLQPGAVIPFMETHVMEHGLYVLEGKAVYRLNRDWVEVEAGDYMWLRAFCPQACYAGGPGPFRYLLYKDVNRHMGLGR